MDGNEPFWLFLGVVAIMAAFALLRGVRRGRCDEKGEQAAKEGRRPN